MRGAETEMSSRRIAVWLLSLAVALAALVIAECQIVPLDEGWVVETYAGRNQRSGAFLARHATDPAVFYAASSDRIWEWNVTNGTSLFTKALHLVPLQKHANSGF
jgi:hypothetical protein